MVTARPGWRRVLPVLLYLLAATVLLLALARPEATAQVPREQATIMLVVDTSGSMRNPDVPPSRIQAASEAANAFLDQLPDQVRVGLVTFAATPTLETVPTTDRTPIRTALAAPELRGGTAVGDALVRSLQASRPPGPDTEEPPPRAILLLTDGGSRSGIPPLAAAQQAREENVPVYTVTIAPQPSAELAQVAEVSGGQAFAAPTGEQLTTVYRDLGSRLAYVEEKRELTSWFMGGAAVFLLLGAAASIAWFLRLP